MTFNPSVCPRCGGKPNDSEEGREERAGRPAFFMSSWIAREPELEEGRGFGFF